MLEGIFCLFSSYTLWSLQLPATNASERGSLEHCGAQSFLGLIVLSL